MQHDGAEICWHVLFLHDTDTDWMQRLGPQPPSVTARCWNTNKQAFVAVALPKMGTIEDTFTLVAAGCPTPLLHPNISKQYQPAGRRPKCNSPHWPVVPPHSPAPILWKTSHRRSRYMVWIEGTNPMDTLSETNGILDMWHIVTHMAMAIYGISDDIGVVSTTRFPRVLVQYVHCQCGSSAPQRLDELPHAPRCSLARLGLHNPLAHQPLVGVTVQRVTCTRIVSFHWNIMSNYLNVCTCSILFNQFNHFQSFSYVFQDFPAPVNWSIDTQRIGPSTPNSSFGPSHTAADLLRTPNLKICATQRRWKMSPGDVPLGVWNFPTGFPGCFFPNVLGCCNGCCTACCDYCMIITPISTGQHFTLERHLSAAGWLSASSCSSCTLKSWSSI